MNRILASEQATLELGAELGQRLARLERDNRNGLQIHLRGDLGAGKTTLVRGLLRSLGLSGPVKSPTYTLVEPYCVGGLNIYHFDLYRLGDPGELEFIGFSDYCHPGAVCCLEWPERGLGWLPPADVVIELWAGCDAHSARVAARSDQGRLLLPDPCLAD